MPAIQLHRAPRKMSKARFLRALLYPAEQDAHVVEVSTVMSPPADTRNPGWPSVGSHMPGHATSDMEVTVHDHHGVAHRFTVFWQTPKAMGNISMTRLPRNQAVRAVLPGSTFCGDVMVMRVGKRHKYTYLDGLKEKALAKQALRNFLVAAMEYEKTILDGLTIVIPTSLVL